MNNSSPFQFARKDAKLMNGIMIAAVLILLYVTYAFGQDQPPFPTSTNSVPPTIPPSITNSCPCCRYPTNGVLKWYLQMPSPCFYGEPSIGPDGTLYVPCIDSGLLAINPALVDTNDPSYPSYADFEKWFVPSSGAAGGDSTPLVTIDGTTYEAVGGQFSAISPEGTNIWAFNFGFQNNDINAQPAVGHDTEGNTIYLPAYGFLFALTNAPGMTNFYSITNIYTFGLTNVGIKWVNTNSDFTYSSPVVGVDGTIYLEDVFGVVYAINPTNGTVLWKTAQILGGETAGAGGGPAIGSDGTIYHTTSTTLYAIDPTLPVTNGILAGFKWTISAPVDPGAFGGHDGYFRDSVVVGRDNVVYAKFYNVSFGMTNLLLCLNATNGTTNWTANLSPTTPNSSEFAQGAIALASDGEIYVADDDGTIYSFCPTGNLNWSYSTGILAPTAPMIGPDGTVYVASANWGTPYLFALQGPAPVDCAAPWPEDRKNGRRTGAFSSISSARVGTLSSPTMLTNGTFQFTITGPTNAVDCICASTNLTSWDSIAEVWLTNGIMNFIDMEATNFPYRFYVPFPQ